MCPHCALETPAPGRELSCSLAEPWQLSWPQAASRSYSAKEGKVSVPAGFLWVQEGLLAQVSKEVSSPGASGSLGWGRRWPSGSLVWVHPPKHHTDRELTSLPLCVCCCSSAPLPSHSRCLEPSPLCKRQEQLLSLCRARRSQWGSAWHWKWCSLPRYPFPVSSRSAENQDLPPPCSWQRAARVPHLSGLHITSGTPQFGNPWYSIIIFLQSCDLTFLNNTRAKGIQLRFSTLNSTWFLWPLSA